MKETQYFTTSNEDLIQAAKLLSDGKTVIFPTETVYGLGANALDENAAEKIFSAKGRPSDNPLIVHISNMDSLGDLVAEVPDIAKKLIDKFWPGPLTLIFKKSDKVPKTVTGGLDTVAVRMPSHSTAKRLLEYAKIPIAAPSANLSGKPSPTIIEHVKEDMDGRVDGIIDGGDCQVGVESTVLDISCETPKLFRPGGVTAEEIEDVIGKKIDIVTSVKEGETPKSPGLKYRHYAPQTQVLILSGTFEERSVYAEKLSKTKKIGLLDFDDLPRICKSAVFSSLGNSKNPLDATHRLFAALRELDKKDIITTPKTEKSVREITIHDELCEDLAEYLGHIYRPRAKTRLFPERTKHFFEKEMDKGIKSTGVKRITVHCLRHSHATMLVSLGFSPQEIAKRLGHAKVTTTIETYCHASNDAQLRIANTLGKVSQGDSDE